MFRLFLKNTDCKIFSKKYLQFNQASGALGETSDESDFSLLA
jgi:hypothetical protein